MFTKDDLKIESVQDALGFAIIAPFVGLIGPFLLAAYTLGFFLELAGWHDT